MNKEGIIGQYEPNKEYPSYYHESDIEQMMDDYCKQEAISFAEFMYKQYQQINYPGGVVKHVKGLTGNAQEYTTSELYNLFLSQKK